VAICGGGWQVVAVDLIHNLSLLVALTIVAGFIDDRWQRGTLAGSLLQGALFGGASVVAMLKPLVLAPGLIFDGRSVMISLCALYFGPVATAAAVSMTLVCRLEEGGVGTPMGVAVILASAALGLYVHHRRRGAVRGLSALDLLAFGLCVHAAMLLMTLTLPRGMALPTLRSVGVPVMTIYPLATVLAGRILADREERARFVGSLRRSEELQRMLLDTIPAPVFHKDGEGRYVRLNAAFCHFFGLREAEIVGRTVHDITAPDMSGVYASKDAELLERSGTQVYEAAVRGPSGDTRIFAIHKAATVGEDGVADGIVGVMVDISERRQAEAALAESEARFRSLVEMAPVGIVVADAEGRCTYVNAAWCAMADMSPEEAIGEGWADALYHEDREMVAQVWADVVRREGDLALEYRLRGKDRQGVWVYASSTTMRDSGGRLIGHIGTTLDTTELKRAEEARLRLEQQVHHGQRLESLGILAGGIAHDFNNILTAVLGHAELALVDLPEGSSAERAIEQVIAAGGRASQLARQMLAYAGRASFTLEPVDLGAHVAETAGLLRASISKKAILGIDVERGLPRVLADPSQMSQLTMNLVINASEALEGDAGTIDVRVTSVATDDEEVLAVRHCDALGPGPYVRLEVADTGCGMTEEAVQRVFDPFYTTKFTGRGLGLAAVLGIVRAHHGGLTIRSRPGEGTTFRVLLPAVPAQAPSGEQGPVAQDWRGRGTVLLADDEEPVREVAEQILQRLGLTVLLAADGQAAVDLFRERGDQIDLVILDLTMPTMDGAEALAAIRSLDPTVRVVIASGYSEQDVASRVPRGALAGMLHKPYSVDQLRSVLSAILPSADEPPTP
jgi:two-component system, cell cycle sensor histidine kinase and response regulator CckA